MRNLSLGLFSALALLLGACDFEIGDLNNPSLEELQNTPTEASLNVACTGLIAGHRAGVAAANGYISQLGILGRESYNFDGADPRYINELLAGTLAKGSPFGGAFWGGPYGNIRLANIILKGVDKVASYSTAERSAIKGFANTFIALDLLRVIVTRDTIGAVIDTDKELGAPLGPIVNKAATLTAIAKYLDDAKAQLLEAGTDPFTFQTTAGFSGFNTPPDFLKFNRAIRARVAIYAEDNAGALTALGESFINAAATTTAALNAGPTFVYSANAGDTANALTNRNIFAHPSIVTDAQLQAGGTPDDRVARKVRTVAAGSGGGLTSTLKFNAFPYTSATALAATTPVPIIRNEELILLRAEAEAKLGMKSQAIADLNIVRSVSGKLPPLDIASTEAQVENEILYNRRYSLLFEGGHRWIDARRFNRITDLPLDKPDHRRNLRFPIPQGECDARPGEAACAIGSID
jgi:starch-binding outer membrane protein, SusD/RagB family